MKKYEHGGNIYSDNIKYDFSANINPLGMPESVKKILSESTDLYEHYPEPYSEKLISAIAEYEKISAENIVCGNGASDLLYKIISVLKPKKAFLEFPSFIEYEKVLSENNCIISENLISDNDLIILGNPNNPTGKIQNKDTLEKICKMCAENDVYFICDECFLDFVKDRKSRSAFNFINKKVIILKAFTKIYAMAGLRLGYAVFGDVELAERVKYSGQCWNVSVPAQIAGIEALKETDYIKRTLSLIDNEKKYLSENLKRLGIKTYESDANFILLYTEIPIGKFLAEKGIKIRSCENFRNLDKNYFRIAVRTHEENTALVKALEEILNG